MRINPEINEIKKRVLIIEDEKPFLAQLEKLLEKEGYEVLTTSDGKEARQLCDLEELDLILCDIRLANSSFNGLDIMKHVRKRGSTPFILMSAYSELSKEEKDERLQANAFLAKPFHRELLVETLKKCLPQKEESPREVNLDDDFCRISISDFTSGKKMNHDVFIRISASNYVLIAGKGQEVEMQRIIAYQAKGVQHLFLKKDDFSEYLRFNLQLTHVAMKHSAIPPKKKLQLIKHTGEVIMEQIFTRDISPEVFQEARSVVESTVHFLSRHDESLSLLLSLNAHSDALYAHSLGVSIYACMIAKKIGWTSSGTIYKISMASLFHEIGQKEINRQIVDKPRHSMTKDEIKIFESHPSRGMEILSTVHSIPNDVAQIVLHHHERDAGTGYPMNLTRSRIHPLARLIAVADEFCDLAISGPGRAALAPRPAFTQLKACFDRTLETSYITALERLLYPNIDME